MEITPLVDTRQSDRLDAAANVVANPFDYCRHQNNKLIFEKLTMSDVNIMHVFNSLGHLQEQVAAFLPLIDRTAIASNIKLYAHSVNICTTGGLVEGVRHSLDNDVAEQLKKELHERLNIQILERGIDAISHKTGDEANVDRVRLLAACIWLSDHLSLAVMGVATVKVDQGTSFFFPTSDAIRRQLRRVWFGSTFEQLSVRAAESTVDALTYAVSHPNESVGDVQKLLISALTIFPQHWRLPFDEGPANAMAREYLLPLLQIVVNVTAMNHAPGGPYPLRRGNMKTEATRRVFDLVVEVQREVNPLDRLFNILDSGLTLGPRDLAPGLLAVSEQLAIKVLGQRWHDDVSKVQKQYVLDRLRKIGHVNVLDFELSKHDTSSKVHVDVDFWVRDNRFKKIYAIQLKHLQASNRGGISSWISRLRNRKSGLGKGVAQLENVKTLIASDDQVRCKLLEHFSLNELKYITPVLLHNVGPLDFWGVQNGVLLYDTGTFCNVLAGRPASLIGTSGGKIISGSVQASDNNKASLHAPESVIAEYLSDPRYSDLVYFDAAARTIRTLSIEGEEFIAEGLGI